MTNESPTVDLNTVGKNSSDKTTTDSARAQIRNEKKPLYGNYNGCRDVKLDLLDEMLCSNIVFISFVLLKSCALFLFLM